jgi:hypothetical protein
MVWSHHVFEASGATSVEEFELGYTNTIGKIYISRGLWARYMRGETLPQGAVSGRSRTIIERLDLQYPGTADIFFHPVWDLLDFNRLLGPEQLLEKYLSLEEDIWLQFVACIDSINPYQPATPATFWPLNVHKAARKMRLAGLSGLDGIAACLIESRLGHLAQDEERFVTSMLVAASILQTLRSCEPFQSTRMRSALLLMEGVCIGYVDKLTVVVPPYGPVHRDLRSKARAWQSNWINRCEAHKKTLSSGALRIFRILLKASVLGMPIR